MLAYRYVLNIHLHTLTADGTLGKYTYWDKYLSGLPQKCPTEDFWGNLKYEDRRLAELQGGEKEKLADPAQRELRGGGGGAGGGGAPGGDPRALVSRTGDEFGQLKGMAGMFLVHAVGTVIALILAAYT